MTKRLTVSINDECADALQAYARAHNVSVTEAVRLAIGLLNLLDVEQTKGNRLAIIQREPRAWYRVLRNITGRSR